MARFATVDDYLTEMRCETRAARLDGVIVSQSLEGSNDISVGTVGANVVLISVSGSDHHDMRIGDVRHAAPAAPGDVALLPAGVSLQSAWRVRKPLQSLALVFDDGLFARFAPEVMSSRFSEGHLRPATYAARPGLSAIAGLLARHADGSHGLGRLFSDTAQRMLALEVAQGFWSAAADPVAPPLRIDRRIRRALDYIEEFFATDLSMHDIAAAAALSLSTLTAQFRKATGQSPYSYVIDRRLTQAVALLQTSNLPIVEVALAAGFADQAHLTRAMRARRNITPGQVRRAG